MRRFDRGDVVRIDIPDETDPDYDHLHRATGIVIEVIQDDANLTTGDERDGYIFRVKLENNETVDLRWRDLRPG
jgi:hypothetical protein